MVADTLPGTLVAMGLGAARTVPVTWLVSPLGGTRLPASLRLGFGLLLAGLASPSLLPVAARAGLDRVGPVLLALLLAREVLIGLTVGLVASFAFRAAEVAGRLGDTLRGANMAEVLVPTADERSSPLGALYLLLATLVFLEIGGVPRLLEALASSYDAVPIGGGLTVAATGRAAAVVALASAKLTAAAVGLAAPVIVALWLTDLALAMIARAAPQIPVYFVGLPLKGLLGIGVVLIGLSALQGALARGFSGWLALVARALTVW